MATGSDRRPRVWPRAVRATIVPFAAVYLLGCWLAWGDGSVLAADGDRLSALGRWLCFGWIPAAICGLTGLARAGWRGDLRPWNARGCRAFAAAFVVTLPASLAAVEQGVHALHRDRVACDGRLRCSVVRRDEQPEPPAPVPEPPAPETVRGAPREAERAARAPERAAPPAAVVSGPSAGEPATAPRASALAGATFPESGPSGGAGAARAAGAAPPGGREAASSGRAPQPSTGAAPGAAAAPSGVAARGGSGDAPEPGAGRFEDGSERRRGEYALDPDTGMWQRDGLWTEWARNGRRISEGRYARGVKTGPWREWHPNGRKKCEQTFVDGRSAGPMSRWHPNGRLAFHRDELTTDDGHVLWIEDAWFDDGAKKSRHQLRDGVRQGPSATWHRNRKRAEAGAWRAGRKDGVWLYWDERGAERAREVWVDGELRGIAPARPLPADAAP